MIAVNCQPAINCAVWERGHGLMLCSLLCITIDFGINGLPMNCAGFKNKTAASSCCQSLVNYSIGIFLLDTWKLPRLVCALYKLVKICHLTSLNLHFCPAARWSWGLNNSKLILLLHSHHILSYTPAAELFNCLYLWGKQALLRAAPVWSIIKYNATWKCIRHETTVWTSHSDFLLVIHFVSAHMLTAAVFFFCVCVFILEAFSALCTLRCFFSFAWLLWESVVLTVCYSSWHLEGNKIMSCLIMLLLSRCSLSTQYYTQ